MLQTKTPRAATSNLGHPEASVDLWHLFLPSFLCHMEKEELRVSQQATTGDRSEVPTVPISTSAILEGWVPGTMLWQVVWVLGQRGEGSQSLFLP